MSNRPTSSSSQAIFYAFRLKPGEDLKQGIVDFAASKKIKAGAIVTCVGSLKQWHLRFANADSATLRKGYFEIVSLTGTFSHAHAHLHIAVSRKDGATIGGHLLESSLIYTTAEIVVCDLWDLSFTREMDATFGFYEMVVNTRGKNRKSKK